MSLGRGVRTPATVPAGSRVAADKIANALSLLDSSPVLNVARGRSLAKRAEAANEIAGRLVDVTLVQLGEVGLDFTIDEVLRAAKVSRKTFYRFFDGKEDLLFAAVEAAFLVSARNQQAVLDDTERSPIATLHAVMRARWDEVLALPRRLTVAVGISRNNLVLRAGARAQVTVEQLRSSIHLALDRCVAAGVLRPSALTFDERADCIEDLLGTAINERLLAAPATSTAEADADQLTDDEVAFRRVWLFVCDALFADGVGGELGDELGGGLSEG